jgi:hypothetical protein
MDFQSGTVDDSDEAALAEIFLPGFRDVDGKPLCDRKRLITTSDRIVGRMGDSILIHQTEVKLARAAPVMPFHLA